MHNARYELDVLGPSWNTNGSGRIEKCTFLETLHTAYSLKYLYHAKVWQELWLIGTGSTWTGISKPVLSRWDHIGDTARHLKNRDEQWLVMSQYIIHLNYVGNVRCAITSYLSSYLKEIMLRKQLEFLCACVTDYYESYTHRDKHVDNHSKCVRFLFVHCGVHYFVMHRDLVQLQTDWAARESFKGFLKCYPQTHSVTAQEFAKNYLSYQKIEWKNIWISGEYKTYLLYLEVTHYLQHVSLTGCWDYLSLYLVHDLTTLRNITLPLTL